MKALAAIALIGLLVGIVGAADDSRSNAAAIASFERKLRHVQDNGLLQHPNPAPTMFLGNEINAYLASGRVQLPAGVHSVHLQSEPGTVTARMRVDFDELKQGKSSFNPLLAIFTGVHDVVVVGHGRGAGGQAEVHIDTVSLDGIEIPRFALQLFVENYLKPKYPDIGLDSQIPLPSRINSAVVGQNDVTIVQR